MYQGFIHAAYTKQLGPKVYQYAGKTLQIYCPVLKLLQNPYGVNHTLSTAFRHLPPNAARFSYATEGSLSCPAVRSAPSERFQY